MTRIFDRSDYESRSLRTCYRELGDRLSDEAALLRSEVHEKHYPGFGMATGGKRRALVQQMRQWNDLFRDYAERLFRLSFDVEQKLIHSIAIEHRPELREIFERVRTRKSEADQILRAIHARLRQFQQETELDTEALYDFCMLAHRAAQFLQFTALVLFATPGDPRIKDPVFRDADWQELDRLGQTLPTAIRAHYTRVEPAPVEAEFVDAVVMPPDGGEPPVERAEGRRSRRAGRTAPPGAAAEFERMRRAHARRRT